jgi:hypothetical protein
MDHLDRNRTFALLYSLGVVGLALLGIALEVSLLPLLIVSFCRCLRQRRPKRRDRTGHAALSGGVTRHRIGMGIGHRPNWRRRRILRGRVLSLGVTAPWLFGCLSLSILMCSLLSYRLSLDGSTLSAVTAP